MKKVVSTVAVLVLLPVVALICGSPLWAQTPQPAPQEGIAKILQPLVDNQTLAGAVMLVGTKDHVLSLEAIGLADVAAKRAMRTDCLFWVASQSKPIAATAMMMLVDEGKVSVDDPVEKYLPEFKTQMQIFEQKPDHVLLKKPTHPVLIRNLLTHTSGLPYKSAVEEPTLDVLPLAVRVRSYTMRPLEFEPGSKSLYSNGGINTAGRIIEVVSGMPYEEFLDTRLFRPLGMKDTTFRPNAEQLARLAKSYKPGANNQGLVETPISRLQVPLDDHRRQPVPGSGLFSTATDLSIFYRMIANDGVFAGRRYLSERAVKQMTSKQTGKLPQDYGFGFFTGGGQIGHGGSYNTNSSYDRERQLLTIFLVQQATWRNEEGKKSFGTFRQAAIRAFSASPMPAGKPGRK